MTHGSLFSGIGGFDLAAQWMGWENKFHCEWNEFGQKVLKHYWPNAELFKDITKSDFTKYANKIDILTGGFPCQPYSSAGKRKGKEDERHLWPQMLRAIREITPTWVVGENVYGLVNWSGGLVFHEVQSDLETEGYEVFPFLLPAVSVNAPHRRDRIWFVAYNNSFIWREGREFKSTEQSRYRKSNERCDSKDDGFVAYNNSINGRTKKRELASQSQHGRFVPKIQRTLSKGNATNSNSNGLNQCNSQYEVNSSQRGFNAQYDFEQIIMHTNSTSKQREHIRQTRQRQFNRPDSGNGINNFQDFPSVSPICNGDDGLSDRLDSITFSKWRNESIKAGGNAIVPQVVYQIFKAIQQYEHQRTSTRTSE